MGSVEMLSDTVFTIAAFAGLAIAVMAAIRGMVCFLSGRASAGIVSLLGGLIVGIVFFNLRPLVNSLTGGLGVSEPSKDPKPSSSPSASPTPSDSPTPTPSADPTPAAPADPVPWGWIAAIAALVVAAVLLGVLVWYLIARGRVKVAEDKKVRAERAERQKKLDARWAKALTTHADLDAEWHAYESDLDTILANPLMRKLEDPAVSEAVRAMGRAQSLRGDKAPRLAIGETVDSASSYIFAVDDYSAALRAAKSKSDLRGTNDFPKDERDNIDLARRLLAMAMNEASTENERQSSYDRVIKIVKKLRLSVPKEAFDKVEITAGVTARGMIEAPKGLFEGADSKTPAGV